jgi:mRNA-degrading endonuclease RelE of RelBE toxin-antitoxin system
MQPRYKPVLHERADAELQQLTDEERDKISSVITDVCETRSPTTHEKVKHLAGQDNAFRIRAGEIRAVGVLDKPMIKIVKIGRRNGVYADIDEMLADRLS